MTQDDAIIEGGLLAEHRALRAAAQDYRLNRGDVGVYSVLLMHARDGVAYPGPTRISEMARLAISNVKEALERLEALKYIAVLRTKARVKNRYRLLQPPTGQSRKAARARAEAMKELGMRAGPVARRSKAQVAAARGEELGMRAGPVAGTAPIATGDACRPATGDACRPELGMRAGTELALNSSSELKEQRTQRSGMPKAAADCFALALGGPASASRETEAVIPALPPGGR